MKLLCIYNIASHYRGPIFRLLDKDLNCDFMVGDHVEDIKKMDYSTLTHKVVEVHNVGFHYGYWQKGVIGSLKSNYDTYLVLGETRCVSTWLFLIVRKLFYHRKRVFLWSHGMLGKESGLKRIIFKTFFSLCNGAFIYNERSVKLMVARGVSKEKLYTIYNSLDYDTQLSIRESLYSKQIFEEHFKNHNKNLIFIGRLTVVKRLDLLINAVVTLKQRGEDVNITFIGDGVERQNLEQMVKSQGLKEQVWFYGPCYDEKTNADLIYNADLCVSPGNIGLTAMHAMMFGCPAITNDDFDHQMPEFEAIQDDKTGVFFHAGDANSLANAISQWFIKHSDDREAVRAACYKEIDTKWTPKNQIRIFKEVLLKQEK